MTAVASVLLLSLPLAHVGAATPAHAGRCRCHLARRREAAVVCTSAAAEASASRAAVLGAYRVRALTRSLTSARTRQLEAIGAEVVVADNHDPSALEAAFAGAAAVYGITTWSGSTFAADGSVRRPADVTSESLLASEVAQGLHIIAAAEAADVGHFVLQSMHRGGLRDGERSADGHKVDASVPAPLHHRAKWRQEEALRASSLRRWSILRQPTYLENFGNDALAAKGTRLRLLQPGVVSGLLAPETELTVIAVDDLGQIALAIMKEGDAYTGARAAAGAERIAAARSPRRRGASTRACASRTGRCRGRCSLCDPGGYPAAPPPARARRQRRGRRRRRRRRRLRREPPPPPGHADERGGVARGGRRRRLRAAARPAPRRRHFAVDDVAPRGAGGGYSCAEGRRFVRRSGRGRARRGQSPGCVSSGAVAGIIARPRESTQGSQLEHTSRSRNRASVANRRSSGVVWS